MLFDYEDSSEPKFKNCESCCYSTQLFNLLHCEKYNVTKAAQETCPLWREKSIFSFIDMDSEDPYDQF